MIDGHTKFFSVKLYDSPNIIKQVLRKVGRSAECGTSKPVTFILMHSTKNNRMAILVKLFIIILKVYIQHCRKFIKQNFKI